MLFNVSDNALCRKEAINFTKFLLSIFGGVLNPVRLPKMYLVFEFPLENPETFFVVVHHSRTVPVRGAPLRQI
jgi:hypothetical protein